MSFLEAMAAFVAVSALVICTPGPDTALTVRNALWGGRRAGVWTAAGVASGQAVWTLATALGITGLLITFEPAFLALKAAGAAYLVYLGAQSLLAALRDGHRAKVRSGVARPNGARAMRQGFVNDLANPKMAAFFVSLLPQFVSAHAPVLPQLLALGLTFSVLTFAWLSAYSVAIDRIRSVMHRSPIRRAVDLVAGTVLVGFGVRLAVAD